MAIIKREMRTWIQRFLSMVEEKDCLLTSFISVVKSVVKLLHVGVYFQERPLAGADLPKLCSPGSRRKKHLK